MWDMRKPDSYYEQFVAHIGPIFSLHWHPEERGWLGTAGRDKLVKVHVVDLLMFWHNQMELFLDHDNHKKLCNAILFKDMMHVTADYRIGYIS